MKQDWEYKKLGELCTVLDSQRKPVTKKDRVSGEYPYYGASGVQDYVNDYIFDGDYLLVGEDGAKWGRNDKSAFQIHGKCWVNNHAHILQINNQLADTSYLEYYLVGKDLNSYITGAIVPKLTQASLVSIPIPIPPIDEQKAICSLLDKMNRVIEAKKEQLKELDNLAQAIFYDMFGDPITNGKGWGVKRMKDVAPAVEYKGEHPQIDGKFWLLNLDKVEAQTGNILSVDYYDYDEIGNSVVSFDSSNVLYSKLRPYLNKVVVPTEIGYATSELVPLQPNISLLERQYLAYMLRSKQFVEFINSKVAGAKMPRVAMNVFRDFLVPVPPLSLQQAFAEKVEAIERQKELINQSIREMQMLFDSRMEYYFGE